MKIKATETADITQTQKTHQQNTSSAGRFDEFLEKAMTPHRGSTASASALSPLQSLSSLSIAVSSDVNHMQTVKNIDGFLNIMESYQTKMADPKATLKDAYPLVQQMQKKTAELIPTCESLPAGDKLKDILNQVLVASTVEIIKFNRGDYV